MATSGVRTILLLDSGISAVGQGTAAAVAQACHVELISAKVLCLGLGLVAAVPVIDHLCTAHTYTGMLSKAARLLSRQH